MRFKKLIHPGNAICLILITFFVLFVPFRTVRADKPLAYFLASALELIFTHPLIRIAIFPDSIRYPLAGKMTAPVE